MIRTLHGIVRGRTIELIDDPGLRDGERVVVDVRSESAIHTPGEGIRRTAGALADDPHWDGIMEEIAAGRRQERGLDDLDA